MRTHDLPLLAWQPECQVIAMPLTRRIGRIREVAAKLHEKPTERAADHYRHQVREGLYAQLHRLDVPLEQQHEMISSFWASVDVELARLNYRGRSPGGGAA